MADGVLRRLVEGCCPPRIRIRRLDKSTTMATLIDLKRKGNDHFGRGEFRQAIDCYDEALESIPEDCRDGLFVVPGHQIEEIVNLLSNKAECLLRRARYKEAAETATEALIFCEDHEKSRLRRARAGLEIGRYDRYEATSRGDNGGMVGVAYLIQARHDLTEVLNHPESTPGGREASKKVLSKVEKVLVGAKKMVLDKNPEEEWDMSVLKIVSRCW